MNTGFLYLNNHCNMSCRHCHVSASVKVGQEMCFETVNSAIHQFRNQGVENIRLTGGEPTLHTEFCRIAEYIYGAGLQLGMVTNGLRIFANRKIRCAVITNFNRVWVSAYGISAAGHDAIRANSGLKFEKLIQSYVEFSNNIIRSKADTIIGLSCIISPTELPLIDYFLDKCAAAGITRLRFIPLQVDGRARINFESDLHEFPELYNQMVLKLHSRNESRFKELRFNDPFDAFQRYSKRGDSCLLNSRTMTSVTATGNIYPCCFLVYEEKSCIGQLDQYDKTVGGVGSALGCKGLKDSFWQGEARKTACPINYVKISG